MTESCGLFGPIDTSYDSISENNPLLWINGTIQSYNNKYNGMENIYNGKATHAHCAHKFAFQAHCTSSKGDWYIYIYIYIYIYVIIIKPLLRQLKLIIYIHIYSNPSQCKERAHTQRNIFEFLLNQTEIKLYLRFSGWFGTKRTSVCFKSNRKMIQSDFGLI